ncbi:MAG TPA: Kiwa anti-phage protein KwaB-like domain-containing protein, partial [Ferruginibacter sp.]|nr:Kiwa anti-phage protein KwaB-like domain-containing protein [Ferruginibacter sp.]
KAKAYLIILRNRAGIQVVGFKTIPENWKMRKSKGLIPLLFDENQFKDLEEENVFSIAGSIDVLFYNEVLFILSKKAFEHGLNFREGMINGANEMYEEIMQLNLFVNIEILQGRVGNNQRYLRKVATIKNLGHYRNQNFLQRMQQISNEKGWNIQFNNGQIIFSEETLDDILTLLQNKRLHSELTDEDFDVESAKPLH